MPAAGSLEWASKMELIFNTHGSFSPSHRAERHTAFLSLTASPGDSSSTHQVSGAIHGLVSFNVQLQKVPPPSQPPSLLIFILSRELTPWSEGSLVIQGCSDTFHLWWSLSQSRAVIWFLTRKKLLLPFATYVQKQNFRQWYSLGLRIKMLLVIRQQIANFKKMVPV